MQPANLKRVHFCFCVLIPQIASNVSLTVNLVCVELPDVGVSLELLLGEREALRVVAVVGAGNVLRH